MIILMPAMDQQTSRSVEGIPLIGLLGIQYGLWSYYLKRLMVN